MVIQSNPLDGSPDNGSVWLMVQVLTNPILHRLLCKICQLLVQSVYWLNFSGQTAEPLSGLYCSTNYRIGGKSTTF